MEGRELGWEAGAMSLGQTSPSYVGDPEQNIVHMGAVVCAVHKIAHWV